MGLSTIDIAIFVLYIVGIIAVGLWVSSRKKAAEKTSEDYFLAGKTLTWWAVGASLIASNISAEQFIGMSGSGFEVGIGIASYELMSALTLVIIAKFFLPIFIKKKIYTMPQFLELRYNKSVKTILAIFWLVVYVFVNLTSVLYLGALSLNVISGVSIMWGIVGLALFSAVYSLYGGLMAIAWTDVIQVVVLIFGGLVTTYIAVDAVGGETGLFNGFSALFDAAPEKFDLILSKDNPHYQSLPGISILVGGLWVANLFYWGCNQYITQRALAAKSLKEAQSGMIFAGFLKILMPVIVVVPGVAAYVLASDSIGKPDEAYPWLLSNLPVGIKGLAFAALIAAIVSSLSSMLNSFSTIFTMDIYKTYINKEAPEGKLIYVGRVSAIIALVVAVVTAKPLLGNLSQAFIYIQEYTGYVSPGFLAIFMLGLFWKKTTRNAALVSAIGTVPLSAAISAFLPQIPFLDRMGIVFLVLAFVMVVISSAESKSKTPEGAITYEKELFNTSPQFNIAAGVICVLLAVIYTVFW